MTWEQLASKIITQMTPEERQGEVKYMESYDSFAIYLLNLRKAEKTVEDADGEVIEEGEWYVW